MKRLITLLTIFGSMLVGTQMTMAKQVTVYFLNNKSWNSVGAWVYNKTDASIKYCQNQNWPGDGCKYVGEKYGCKVYSWTGDVDENNTLVIFNDNVQNTQTQTDKNGFELKNGAYYNFSGLYHEYELVTYVNGVEKVLPLSPSRERDGGVYSDRFYTIGFKDDLLSGKTGDEVSFYIRDKQDGTQYRPLSTANNGNFGTDDRPAGLVNSNIAYYGTAKYTTASSSNVFTLKKGEYASYTIGLNLGDAVYSNYGTGKKNDTRYWMESHSVSIYKNASIKETYKNMFAGTYKDGKTKDAVEDYYLIGCLDGVDYNNKTKAENLMKKQVFVNPVDENKVDSIVYSIVINKPDAGFGKLYLGFMPKSLADASTTEDGSSFSFDKDKTYGLWSRSNRSKWNYIIRPEIQDNYDGTAPYGSVMMAGTYNVGTDWGCQNGNQALNPIVSDDSYKYYIVRLNVTTSTYRIEFVDDPSFEIKNGIRTFSYQANLRLPDDGSVRAYAVHSYTSAKKNGNSFNGHDAQGVVELRRLKYIPANEGVVLVYKDGKTGTDGKIKFSIISDAASDSPVTDVEEDWWAESHDKTTEKYNNYLKAVLFGANVNVGDYELFDKDKYHYLTRNFTLGKLSATKYWDKDSSNDDYIGFFRYEGDIEPNKAYLQLPYKDKDGNVILDYDGQAIGGDKDDDGENTGLAKVMLSFDDVNGGTTGINEVKAKVQNQEDAYYNLQGVKVSHPVKGLYIHNGKKVVF